MKNLGLLLVLVLVGGCQWVTGPEKVNDFAGLIRNVGKQVELEGKVAQIAMQEMISSEAIKTHPKINHVVLHPIPQLIVVYSKKPLPAGKLRIKGKVIEVKGKGKSPEQKDREFLTFQVVADEIEQVK